MNIHTSPRIFTYSKQSRAAEQPCSAEKKTRARSGYLFTGTGHLAEFTVFPLRRVNRHLPLLVPPEGTSHVWLTATGPRRATTVAAPTPASLRRVGLRLAVVGGDGIQRLVETWQTDRQCYLSSPPNEKKKHATTEIRLNFDGTWLSTTWHKIWSFRRCASQPISWLVWRKTSLAKKQLKR